MEKVYNRAAKEKAQQAIKDIWFNLRVKMTMDIDEARKQAAEPIKVLNEQMALFAKEIGSKRIPKFDFSRIANAARDKFYW